ncbi:MAG: hypothetical protein H6822_34335 [Planctomycetaceae bacterium]|nr:hypothetical protein [Planctomycetales bacterium]MCB9927265.1 hypothetical protein [Planctomycetaceae bacterium]
MHRLQKPILTAAMFLCVAVCLSDSVFACPTCKDGMAGDPAYSSMVKGYFWSILFMMSMPFLVFTSISAYFYYVVSRARAQQRAAVASSAAATDSAESEVALQS